MKTIIFLFSLFIATLAHGQEYKYGYTPTTTDTSEYMLDIRGKNLIIGIGMGNPLVIPFDCLTYDLKTGVNIANGEYRVFWTDERLFCYHGFDLLFVLSDEPIKVKFNRK